METGRHSVLVLRHNQPMEPVPARERIQEIDVLRGWALFGIIAANMLAFNSPIAVYMQPHLLWTAPADRITQALIACFISGKFITLFGLLFGLGFGVQMGRAGEGFTSVYLRRLTALTIIGAMHIVLLWCGDILLTYALMGFVLLLFRDRAQSTIMLWAMILYWFPILAMAGFAVMSAAGASSSPAAPEATAESLQRTIAIYAEGGYGAILAERLREWQEFNASAPFFYPRVLSFFLFGLYIWRRGVFQDLPAHLPLLRKTWKWALAIGLAGNIGFVLIKEILQPDLLEPSLTTVVVWTIGSIGIPALSLFYACAIILLFQREAWRRWLLAFGAVGRMALTNYLLQSVLCTALFYGYGLGLYAKVGPLVGLIPTVLIYASQIPFSAGWLRAFRFGPVEWMWRCATYGRLQPMRRQSPIDASA